MFRRCDARLEAELDCAADAAWHLLNDWAGILRWWPANPPMPIVEVTLSGAADAVPRARHITLAGGSTAVETLLHADPVARRIYYDLSEGGIPMVRNYLASTVIDALGEGRCRIIFSSTFDVAESDDEDMARAIILSVYGAIRDGFTHHFAKAAA